MSVCTGHTRIVALYLCVAACTYETHVGIEHRIECVASNCNGVRSANAYFAAIKYQNVKQQTHTRIKVVMTMTMSVAMMMIEATL